MPCPLQRNSTRNLANMLFPFANVIFIGMFAGLSAASEPVGYDQVKEIFRKRCVTCHNPDELRGDLDLKDLAGIKAGSASGPVVVAKDPSASLLYTTVAHLEDPVMPPNSPRLPAREQDLIRRWIEGGLRETSLSNVTSETKPPMESGGSVNQPSTVAEGESNSPIGLVEVRSLPQASAIRAMDAHPNRDLIAVGGLRQVVLIEPSTARFLGALDTPQGTVTAIRFSADGKLLLVGVSRPAVHGTVLAFDLQTAKVQWQVGDETDSILAMDLSADGKTLAVGGPSKTVRLYDTATGAVIFALKKHTDWVLNVRFSPDSLLLASADRFGAVLVWETKSGTIFQNLRDHAGPVHSLAWDNSSESLISAGDDGILRNWNLHHGELTHRWQADVGAILAIAKANDSIAAVGRKNKLSLWTNPDDPLGTVDLPDQGEAVAICADRRNVVVTDASGRISIIGMPDQRLVHQLVLPTDANSMSQLLQQVEVQHAEFMANLESKQQAQQSIEQPVVIEQSSQISNGDTAVTGPVKSDSSQVSTVSPVNIQAVLQTQVDYGKSQLQQATVALQASNKSLASLAKLNEDLLSLTSQTSQIQAQLAQQIAEQTRLLQELRTRLRHAEEALKASGVSGASPEDELSNSKVGQRR